MKKILMCLFLISGILNILPLQADLADIMAEELRQRSFEFSNSDKKAETHLIKYAVAKDGSLMHFGIWSDCIIGTVVGSANNIGAQMITLSNGVMFDQSANYKVNGDHFVNKYSWGKITSWDHKQVIERY